MATEQEPMNIYQAINEVSRRVGGISKDGYNQHQNYNFRGIDQLVTAVQPILNEVGLTITPNVLTHTSEDRPTERNVQRWCTVKVKYTLTGPAGDQIETYMVGEAADTADKAMNKALSNAAKYFYFQTFWFGIGGMDDGDFDHPTAERSQPAPQASGSAPSAPSASPQRAGAASPANAASEPQRKKIWAMAHKTLNWDDPAMFQQIQLVTDRLVPDLEDLSKAEASKVIEAFQKQIDARA